MQYKYRWLYVCTILVVFTMGGFFYVIQPACSRLAELQTTEKKLNETLAHTRQMVRRSRVFPQVEESALPVEQTSLLSDLLKHAQVNGLIVQSANLISRFQSHEVRVKFAARGDFQQISQFIFSLNRQVYPMGVLDFSLEVAERGPSLFSATILMLKSRAQQRVEKPDGNEFSYAHDPFCANPHFLARVNQEDSIKLQSFSVSLMKMVGSFQQGQHKQALFLLPNNDVVAAQVGALIGRERGRVYEIEARRVLVLMPNKKRVSVGIV